LAYINNIMKHTFFKESVIYGFTGALSNFSVFLTIPVYTRYLSVEQFGVLDLYLTISMIFYILLEMQMASGFMRSYYEKKESGKLDLLLGSVLKFYIYSFTFAVLLFTILYLSNYNSKYFIYSYIVPIILYILPKQIFDLNNIIMRMEHQAIQYLKFNIYGTFFITILSVVFVLFKSSIESVLWSIFFGNAIVGYFAYKNIKKLIGIKLNFVYLKEIAYYGIPIIPAVIGGWAMNAIGRVYISEYLNNFDLGLYSFALKIGMIFLLFIQAFRMAWEPFVIKKFGEEATNSKEIFAKALNYYFILGFIIVGIIYIITPFLIKILATKQYLSSISIVPMLLLAYFWQGAINIIAVGNSWVRKTYLNSIGSLVGALTVILFSFLLIQQYKLYGVALAQIIGFITSFFITMYFAQKNVYIGYSKSSIVMSLILTIILISSNWRV